MKSQFTEEQTQMVNKHMERHSNELVIKKCKLK